MQAFLAGRSSLAAITLLLGVATFPLYGHALRGARGRDVPGGGHAKPALPDSLDRSSAKPEALRDPIRTQSTPVHGQDSKSRPANKASRHTKADFNRNIYYRNKLEFSYEVGWLPINIPLIWDVFLHSPYTRWPLSYTLVPNIASLRWHVDGIHGPSILRGDTDFTFSGSFTAIPRGAETRYPAFIFGIRRNFVQPNWRFVPYYEMRGGVGNIDAKGPAGVLYAQGQDLTFTNMVGSGVRFDFNSKYSIEAGATYMHVSNGDMSEPIYENFGINVWGPIVGINVRLGSRRPRSAE